MTWQTCPYRFVCCFQLVSISHRVRFITVVCTDSCHTNRSGPSKDFVRYRPQKSRHCDTVQNTHRIIVVPFVGVSLNSLSYFWRLTRTTITVRFPMPSLSYSDIFFLPFFIPSNSGFLSSTVSHAFLVSLPLILSFILLAQGLPFQEFHLAAHCQKVFLPEKPSSSVGCPKHMTQSCIQGPCKVSELLRTLPFQKFNTIP